jgi:DNA repair exonuclease SbcCD nuclease subunit
MAKPVSFIHTADLHLGRSFLKLSGKGKKLREAVISAFNSSVDAAIDKSVGFYIIAGDLFDSPRPPKNAMDVLDKGFKKLIEAGISICIAPGTHDPFGSSVYNSDIFNNKYEGLYLLTPENPSIFLDKLNTSVGAWFPSSTKSGEWTSPPTGWPKSARYKIGMAHGSVLSGLEDKNIKESIPEALLNNEEIDYLALGHFHGCGPVNNSTMPAYYSGSPEMLAVDQVKAGYVLHVELSEKDGKTSVSADQVKVGTLEYKKLTADAAEILKGLDIEREIDALADPNLFLDVKIEGLLPLDAQILDCEELSQAYQDKFFNLRIIDQIERTDEVKSLEKVPVSSVTAEFIKGMKQKIEDASTKEKSELEEALRMGLHYLMGNDQS